MNILSGFKVGGLVSYYKIPAQQVLVVSIYYTFWSLDFRISAAKLYTDDFFLADLWRLRSPVFKAAVIAKRWTWRTQWVYSYTTMIYFLKHIIFLLVPPVIKMSLFLDLYFIYMFKLQCYLTAVSLRMVSIYLFSLPSSIYFSETTFVILLENELLGDVHVVVTF